MAKASTAAGFDASAARDLVQRALSSAAGPAVVSKSGPVIEAALELVRESSLALGRKSESITGINIVIGGRDERDSAGASFTLANEQPTSSGPGRTPTNAKEPRIPISYGGTGYVCVLLTAGPPPVYLCVSW